jgi:mannopine transport system substrate-binding protein
MADGGNRDKLFSLDIDGALKELDEIRPTVSIWWKTGDQSVQGFRNGDYVLGQIWLTRARAMQNEGLPPAARRLPGLTRHLFSLGIASF